MHYFFSIPSPSERFVSIELIVNGKFEGGNLELQLPAWRPGRYELGNFAKNIRAFAVLDANGKSLEFKKFSKDNWRVSGITGSKVTVKYQYYSAQLDGGACWLDESQLYINPVHCCMFIPGRENENCKVTLNIPENWKVATGLKKLAEHNFEADNFDQLADSPFIASPSLMHASYTMDGIDFNIWIQGNCNPDWPRIISDFEKFTRVQLDMMKVFPADDFHFLVQVLPYKFYHGVEHLNSTVLAIGPGMNLMKDDLYNDFLGVASHELFHCWNVKSIRPVEMLPYDFTKENYADTGYVYEGVTTYYGDLFLGRSGFFTLQQMLDEFSIRLQKHMDNPARFNYAVAQSSFDTWLDGYVPGVPGRKTSIYDEGCLLAWMLDFMIRSATESKKSLDHVMQVLYFDYAKKGKGYSAKDYREVAEMVAGREFEVFFNDYIDKPASLNNILMEVVSLAGLTLEITPATSASESLLGIKTEIRGGAVFVSSVYPGSPASKSGLSKDDELIAINGIRVENNLNDLVEFAKGQNNSMTLLVASSKAVKTLQIKLDDKNYYSKYKIISDEKITHGQLLFRQEWLKS